MTGLGLYEYTHQKFGSHIRGLNFASSLPVRASSPLETRNLKLETARAPEVLALRLLQTYESKRIRHPIDRCFREDLHKPEPITTSDGRVSIVASRTESGHADHFWSWLSPCTTTSNPSYACAKTVWIPGRTAAVPWRRHVRFCL